ncbi:MAG: hypothetical protein K2N54_08145 [Helicobacter sp.]|nr:hypothetical protein [Helicobacter sp.]
MSHSTALRLCYAFGSNIDVARYGWDVRIGEQWQAFINGGAVLSAHKRESHTKSATEVAPPILC